LKRVRTALHLRVVQRKKEEKEKRKEKSGRDNPSAKVKSFK